MSYVTTFMGYGIADRPMKLGTGPGIWVFVSTPLLVTERQLLPEPQRRSSHLGVLL